MRVSARTTQAATQWVTEGLRAAGVHLVNETFLHRWQRLTGSTDRTVRARLFERLPPRLNRTRQVPREVLDTLAQARFEDNRYLVEYRWFLGSHFWDDLRRLRPEGHWFDGGCGNAKALLSYLDVVDESQLAADKAQAFGSHFYVMLREARQLSRRGIEAKAKVTGVTYRTTQRVPPLASPYREKFCLLEGQPLETILLNEIGPADLITDLFGIFPYSHEPDLVLARYLALLKPAGSIYIYGSSFPRGYAAQGIVLPRTGSGYLTIDKWLDLVRGVELKRISAGGGGTGGTVYCIRRQPEEPILIPRLRYLNQDHPDQRGDLVPLKRFQLV